MQYDKHLSGNLVILHDLPEKVRKAYALVMNAALLIEDEDALKLVSDAGAPLVYPPQNAVAVVSGSPQNRALAAWYEQAGLEAPLTTHAAELPALLTGFAAARSKAAAMNTDLMVRLAELRAVHEEVLNGYNALRNFVAENGLAPPRPGFLNLPEADGEITLDEGVVEVVQPLPVDMRSMCGFALYLPAAVPQFTRGVLQVYLAAAEDDGLLLHWEVPYARLPQGWVTFAFEQSDRFWRKTPVLRLCFETEAGIEPRFSLSQPQLREDKGAMINNVRNARSLAFKTWISIPGAPLAVTNQMWPAIKPRSELGSQIEIVLHEGLTVTTVPGQEERSGFQVVTLLPEQCRLQVHPFENMVSTACLPRACLAGTSVIIAGVETAHPNAGQIEYALAVAPPGGSEFVTEDGCPANAQISDWTALPPETPSQIRLRLNRPLRAAADLYLMTRLSPGEVSNYGWAQFHRISLRGQFSA